MKKITKAVFPVAGMGTRFLPATKSVPKEMLTVVDRPVIDYAVREAVEAGCDTLIFITGRSKQAIANYFDRSPELENELEEKNKIHVDYVKICFEFLILPKSEDVFSIVRGEVYSAFHDYLAKAELPDKLTLLKK